VGKNIVMICFVNSLSIRMLATVQNTSHKVFEQFKIHLIKFLNLPNSLSWFRAFATLLGLSMSEFGHPVTIQISAAYIIQLTEHAFIVAVFEMAAVLRFFVIKVTDTTIYFCRKMRNIIQLFRYIVQTQKLLQPWGPYSLSVQWLPVQGQQQAPSELFLLVELPIRLKYGVAVDWMVQCYVCPDKFSLIWWEYYLFQLKQHFQKVHMRVEEVKCMRCGIVISNKYNLVRYVHWVELENNLSS